MIPKYPAFARLNDIAISEVRKIVAQFDPYSDFNIASLSCWDTDGSASVSTFNGNLIIRLPDYVTNEPVLSVIGNTNTNQVMSALLRDVEEVRLVPEVVTQTLASDAFTLVEDRDNFDYIYETQRIANLAGGEFKDKRNKINRLIHDIGDGLTVYSITKISEANKTAIISIFDEWASNRKLADDDVINERTALERFLGPARPENVLLTLVRYKDREVAFGLQEIINDSYAMFHFGKSLLSVHKNLDNFVSVQATLALVERNIAFTNWEQDLGISGLRQAKNSYQPYKFLKKYTIRKRN